MNALLKYIGWLALAVTALSPLLYFTDRMTDGTLRVTLLVAMVVWFAVAVIRDRQISD
jgi:hypothetical protein